MTFAVKGTRRSDDRPVTIRWDEARGWSTDSRTMHELIRYYTDNVTVWVTPEGPAIPNDPCDGVAASLVALALLGDTWIADGDLPGIPDKVDAEFDAGGRASS